MKKKDHLISWRLNFIKFGSLLFFVLLAFRFFQIQVMAHDRYLVLAEKQHWARKEIPAERGKILTADGFPLATDINAYLLYAVPPEIEKPKETAEKLIEILGFESEADQDNEEEKEQWEEDKEKAIEELKKDFENHDCKWLGIAKKVDEEIKEKVESLNIKGLYFEKGFKRYYPEGNLAAHVLGFVGSDDKGSDQGYYGIEGYYNGTLKGLSGKISQELDAAGRPIPVGLSIPLPAENGQDIVLTLNRELQFLLEKHLKEGTERYDADSGSAIILDPETGAILAMANYPTYHPGDWEKFAENDFEEDEIKEKYQIGKDIFKNLTVAGTYEPGSVFKMVTMSAGIDTQKVTPETTFESKPFEIQGHTIRTWDDKYYGDETMIEILQHSDNTGAAWLATQLGLDVFYEYVKKFHFGELMGIGLEDEETGIIKPQEEWMPIDLATSAFGQGIAVTPLQLIAAFEAIANNGVYLKPYIIKEIRGQDQTINLSSNSPERVVSEETARTLVDMLTTVVERGEFKFAILPEYKVAGKTGTAQIPRGGVYDPHKTNCTFVGFAPASSPKFVMLVKLSKPTASSYSAETAVPLWMKIAKDLFLYYGIAPQ